MLNNPPGPGTYYECPVNRCAWIHRRPEPGEVGWRPGFTIADLIAQTVVAVDAQVDEALLAHLGTHTALEYAQTIAELRAELASSRQLVSAGQ